MATLRSFILQMTTRPEIQRRAQEELDSICPDRLVTFADRENLPYIECLVMEIYRFHPILPSGLSHANEQEDAFEGMRIPKGSIMMPNIWYLTISDHVASFYRLPPFHRGMSHDETMYPSPHAFEPARYLKDGKVSSDIRDPRSMFFGFGRRYWFTPSVFSQSSLNLSQSMSRKGLSRCSGVHHSRKYSQTLHNWTSV